MKSLQLVFSFIVLIIVLASNQALAITQPGNATVTFLAPLTMTLVTSPSFGKLPAGLSNATTYEINTSNTLTTTGTGAELLSGSTTVGEVSIFGSNYQAITIIAQNPVASGGVTITGMLCRYGSDTEANCFNTTINGSTAPGPSGTALLLGPTISVPSLQAVGAVTPSFSVVIAYQ